MWTKQSFDRSSPSNGFWNAMIRGFAGGAGRDSERSRKGSPDEPVMSYARDMEHTDNGILTTVPGDYTHQAMRTLPAAATAPQEKISVIVAAGHLGPVRIDFRRYRYRHYKNTVWAWSAVRAEKVDA